MNDTGVVQVGRGPQGASVRDFDWSATPLGSRETWSGALTAVYEMMMASPFAMCAGWGPELTFIYNEAYTDFLAARHPAALGQPIKDVWHDVWADIAPLIQQAMAGEEVRHTDMHLVMTRKGHTEDTYWTFAYSPLRDGKAVVGFIDIAIETTAGVLAGQRRDAAEGSLRELNATLEQQVAERTEERNRIWQVSRDMLVVAEPEGSWLSVNPAWTRVLGWTGDELVGRTSEWIEHPDDRARSRAEAALLAQGHFTVNFENRFRTRAGDYRDLSWTAVMADNKIYAAARDVTDEKVQAAVLADQALRLKLFGDVVQANKDPICVFDTDYRLTAFNQAHSDEFFRIFGHRVQLGEVFPDLFPPEQAPIMRGFMARALAGESYTVTEEFGDPDLAKPYWEVTYFPLRDPEGRLVGAFHHAKDIMDRLRAEAELATMQEALRQSQKMEAVGQLTGGIAHDFNNLLAVITGSLELLDRRVTQGRTSELSRFVLSAQAAAKRATALTHRLLAFSRRQTLDPKPTGINQLIAGMDELIRRTVGPSIEVEVVGAAGLWTTFVDPSQLDNALLNLCINSRDAMPDGGRLTIETANRWLDERAAKERDMPPGQYVSLSVSDTGCGMPPDIIAKAFDPFFTTKPIGQGTGLGLSMTYGFARQSGGQVRIYSEARQGTTITIYLPRYYGDEVETDELSIRPPEPAECGQTVLVVDDEPGVRMLVAEVLEELRYEVVEAEDGPSALKILNSKARIDLLVTDVGLPGGMNGRQVADAARSLRPGLKVLFMTGYAENAVVGNGYLDPGMSVITKPFAVDIIGNRIKELIS